MNQRSNLHGSNSLLTGLKRSVPAYSLLGPAGVLLGLTLLYPILYQFSISLTYRNLMFPQFTGFAGLKNYADIMRDPAFLQTGKVTLYFVAVSVVLELLLGLFVALVLNQEYWGRGLVRAIVLIPWALPEVVAGLMWGWILNANFGALNGLLHQLGLIDSYIPWLSYPFVALNAVTLVNVWKSTPFVAILLLAGLQTIPSEIYESATVDGAGGWDKFWRITFPLLKPVLFTCLILQTIWAFKTFDLIFIMTKGGPGGGTLVLPYLVYFEAFGKLNFGTGAAMSFILVAIILVVTFIYIKAFKPGQS